MKKYKIKLADIDAIAVYQGPGSYTGLRVGISVANAMAWALNIPVVGIKKPSGIDVSSYSSALEIAKKVEKIVKKKSVPGGSALYGKFAKIVIPYYGSYLK